MRKPIKKPRIEQRMMPRATFNIHFTFSAHTLNAY